MPRLVPSVVTPGSIARLKQPTLTGDEGISLRAWTETDVGAVVDAFLDPDIQRWHLRCLDAEEARRWIEAWQKRWAKESDASWAISTGGNALGYIALRDIDLEFRNGEITYWGSTGLPATRTCDRRCSHPCRMGLDCCRPASLGDQTLDCEH